MKAVQEGYMALVSRKSEERGQVLVLGCLTLLMLALSTMLSFSVAHSVHEKIRLQSYADASAYSMAVVEARAMNYIAYSNRAIAATFVSMATTHAYVAAANSVVLGPATGSLAMLTGAGIAAATFQWGIALELGIISGIYLAQIAQFGNMEAIERPLDKAIEHFVKMIQSIHKSQREVVKKTGNFISSDILKKSGAPCAQAETMAFRQLNKEQFACALESSPLDEDCDYAKGRKTKDEDRKKIMANVVNASRPSFIDGEALTRPHFYGVGQANPIYHENYVDRYLDTIPNPTGIGSLGVTIQGYMADGTSSSCASPSTGSNGDTICAKADKYWMAFVFLRDSIPIGGMINPANIIIGSNKDGGPHNSRHSSQHKHNKYKGMFNGDCDGNDAMCFINYRVGTKEKNWGQPLVFFLASQELKSSVRGDNCNEKPLPWHLNQRAEVRIEHGQRGTGRLSMGPTRRAHAASQAMVYFHRTKSSWQAPPNLFEPYWRAKLHPFEKENLKKLLGSRDIELVIDEVPVEGKSTSKKTGVFG